MAVRVYLRWVGAAQEELFQFQGLFEDAQRLMQEALQSAVPDTTPVLTQSGDDVLVSWAHIVTVRLQDEGDAGAAS